MLGEIRPCPTPSCCCFPRAQASPRRIGPKRRGPIHCAAVKSLQAAQTGAGAASDDPAMGPVQHAPGRVAGEDLRSGAAAAPYRRAIADPADARRGAFARAGRERKVEKVSKMSLPRGLAPRRKREVLHGVD